GRPVHFALEAAGELEKEGIDIEVIDVRTYRPLDIETIANSVRKTNYCVVVDQSWPFASVAAEIAAQVHERCFDDLDNSVKRINNDDIPPPYNRSREQDMLPNARKIAEAVRQTTYNA
ncbi:MAG: transketolase C-terminal domain-containing protein, partial [Planctomycetota bacterium]